MNIALESTKPTQESPSPTQALEYPVYKKKGSKLYGKKWNAFTSPNYVFKLIIIM